MFGHKKEWSADTCYNGYEAWTRYAEWNKPDTKGQILYDFIYMKSLKETNPQRLNLD